MPDVIRVFFNVVQQLQLFERIPYGIDRFQVVRSHVFCRHDLFYRLPGYGPEQQKRFALLPPHYHKAITI